MAYPPGPSSLAQAEEYELGSPATPQTKAGPSKSKQKTFTLHPSHSTSALLFSAPGNAQESPRRRKVSGPQSPEISTRRSRIHFLHDDQHDAEEVHVPDFGHMLGMGDEAEDHFAIADRMRSPWKRRLYLLMEAPESGREAFYIHVAVTGAILFRSVDRRKVQGLS